MSSQDLSSIPHLKKFGRLHKVQSKVIGSYLTIYCRQVTVYDL